MHTLLHRAQTFLAVVDFGSYTRAADFLGISKAMASLHVKALEEALSVALLVRNTRSIALTETGREFYDEFKGIVRDVGSAFDNAMHSGNRIAGRLRISTTSEYGEKYILPLIPAFLERYPGISVAYDVNSSLSDLVAESWTWSCAWATWRTPASKAAGWPATTSCWWPRPPSCAAIPCAGPKTWQTCPGLPTATSPIPRPGRCALPAARA